MTPEELRTKQNAEVAALKKVQATERKILTALMDLSPDARTAMVQRIVDAVTVAE